MKKRAMKKWIPKGVYCDGCKWHSINKKLPEQENGSCKYLNKNDYQLNEIYNKRNINILSKNENGEYISEKTTMEDKFELHFPTSLLWDGCKECSVKK